MPIPTKTSRERMRENTLLRQRLKKKWDRTCRYSVDENPSPLQDYAIEGAMYSAEITSGKDNWCRLLDEGVVVDNNFFTGEPYIYACIRKGVIKDWYNSLPADFVGTIDKDHNRSIDLGTFTKDSLRLVELPNGRYALDVNVKLDEDLYAVKDLLKMNNRTALSVEMYTNAEQFVTASSINKEITKREDYLVPLIDELKIEGYAVCMAPKSANSYKDDLLENAESNINLNEENVVNDNTPTTEKVENTPATDMAGALPTDQPVEQPSEATETTEVETVEVVEETEASEQPAEEAPATEENLDAVEDAIKTLKAENEALKAENADLSAKLEASAKKQESFETRLSKVLSFASSSEPTGNEGGEPTTPENSKTDALVDAYASAFKEME